MFELSEIMIKSDLRESK